MAALPDRLSVLRRAELLARQGTEPAASFTEGSDTPDLVDAKTVLAELG